jgi:hypothetical protein
LIGARRSSVSAAVSAAKVTIDSIHVRRFLPLFLAGALALTTAALASAQARYIKGVFVASPEGSIVELIAYAEARGNGSLEMSSGFLEDAPTLNEVHSVLCSEPLWRPIGMFVASSTVFRNERADLRQLSITLRQRNVYTFEVRASDLEHRATIERILKSLNASADSPAYAFVVVSMRGVAARYYPIRLTPAEP